MANIKVKDADASDKYLKASGAGSDVDPHIPEHLDTNSAAILTAVQAVQAAVEVLDNAISGTEMQVDVVAALPAGSNAIGMVGQAPQTSGGYSVYRDIDLDETGISVKGSAGQIFGWFIYNLATAKRYIKFYNTAGAPTVGTDTPILTIPLDAGQGANVELLGGLACGNGIGIGATTGLADNDTGAPGANEIVVNVFYK